MIQIIQGDDPYNNFTCVLPSEPRHVILINDQPKFKRLTELMFEFKVSSWMTPLDMLIGHELITFNNNYSKENLTKLLDCKRVFIPDFDESNISKLSTGQKQLLYILLTVINTDEDPTLLLMDCMDSHLHIDWQKKLIRTILSLNPNLQLIISTHSPSVIDTYFDQVKEINQLIIS